MIQVLWLDIDILPKSPLCEVVIFVKRRKMVTIILVDDALIKCTIVTRYLAWQFNPKVLWYSQVGNHQFPTDEIILQCNIQNRNQAFCQRLKSRHRCAIYERIIHPLCRRCRKIMCNFYAIFKLSSLEFLYRGFTLLGQPWNHVQCTLIRTWELFQQ